MNQEMSVSLWGTLKKIAEDCEEAIKPNSCILEETKEGTAYHFMVPNNSRRQIIAWGHLRPGGSNKLGVNEPCVTVHVYAGLLNIIKPPFSNHFYPKANYGKKGKGEVQFAIRKVGDENYRLALKALIETSKKLI